MGGIGMGDEFDLGEIKDLQEVEKSGMGTADHFAAILDEVATKHYGLEIQDDIKPSFVKQVAADFVMRYGGGNILIEDVEEIDSVFQEAVSSIVHKGNIQSVDKLKESLEAVATGSSFDLDEKMSSLFSRIFAVRRRLLNGN